MTWLEILGAALAIPGGLLVWDALHGFRCWGCGARPGHPHPDDCGTLRAVNYRRRNG
jgi:hypothetical protein